MLIYEYGFNGFQSLFWWNVVTYRSTPRSSPSGVRVSILVLVECSYLQPDWQILREQNTAFQSLFWWNVVTYNPRVRLAIRRRDVSILVLVECSYLLHLSWYFLAFCMVSILVLVECSYLQNHRYRDKTGAVTFQSLFWWNVVTYTIFCG